MEMNEITVMNTANNLSVGERFDEIHDRKEVWAPKRGETLKDRSEVYNALNAASENLGNHQNEKIRVTNLVMRGREVTDKETGELKEILEVLLVSADGTIYRSSSSGIIRSVEGILSVVGGPESWGDGLDVMVRSVPTSKGHTYLLELV